ncbi:hypothetical protein DEJ13_02245 [Curtobacterium sp. MCLR17_007]|uniref:hypothetical protein n=1 Tax=Curtobacterium sp. MCLR17_007 TaxID=2175648 RepID=UPI0011B62736|nr:hypothetical protein [Curtobacterium sp. MCLR17_007]WIB60670.1 hypothetical protein DEJ13_02245 [Curtobacterium sp. MCLR17_007]
MRVMVSVGTHEQPFQRLLDAVADAVVARPEDEWVVQFGVGRWTLVDDRVRAADYLDASAMRAALDWADVLVSQSSPGNVFGALEAGTWPMVLGRTPSAGEHVDDHQVRFASALVELGHATDLGHADRLVPALAAESAAGTPARRRRIESALRVARDNERRFRRDVWTVLGSLA